jgi:hypothetical protein
LLRKKKEDYDFEKPLSFAFMHCITEFSQVRKLRGAIRVLRLKNNYEQISVVFAGSAR